MELRHLRYFLAIAQEGGFRRAAARIHVAQQALSTQIANLEAEVGVQLFERLSRGIRLSAAGREFLPHAESIVREVGVAQAMLRRLAHGHAGILRVGRSNPMYFAGILGRAFHAFRARAPAAELAVSEMQTKRQLEALSSGTIDVGLGATVPGDDTSDFAAELIAEQAISGFLLSHAHPFALRKRLTTAELADQPLAIAARDATPAAIGYLIEQLERNGFARGSIELVDDPGLLLERVEYEGVLAPAAPTFTRAVPRGIVFRPVRGLRIPYALTARWRQTDPNPLIAELLDALRSGPSTALRPAQRPLEPVGTKAAACQ
jgi:DNA-binding transcriptional LysR family regulator